MVEMNRSPPCSGWLSSGEPHWFSQWESPGSRPRQETSSPSSVSRYHRTRSTSSMSFKSTISTMPTMSIMSTKPIMSTMSTMSSSRCSRTGSSGAWWTRSPSTLWTSSCRRGRRGRLDKTSWLCWLLDAAGLTKFVDYVDNYTSQGLDNSVSSIPFSAVASSYAGGKRWAPH